MNVYHIFNDSHNRICRINLKNNKNKKSSLYSIYVSPLLAIFSTGYKSCSSSLRLVTLSSMSSIVGVGITTAFASLMTEYQFPIRLITLAILEWSFVSINRAINNNSIWQYLILQ